MFSKSDRMWLACAIDCDGYVGMKKQPSGKEYIYIIPSLGFTNTCKPLVERVADLIGSKTHTYRTGEKKRLCYLTRIHSSINIRIILKQIIPHLIAKKERAQLILAFCNHKLSKPAHHGPGKSERLKEDNEWFLKYNKLYPYYKRNKVENQL